MVSIGCRWARYTRPRGGCRPSAPPCPVFAEPGGAGCTPPSPSPYAPTVSPSTAHQRASRWPETRQQPLRCRLIGTFDQHAHVLGTDCRTPTKNAEGIGQGSSCTSTWATPLRSRTEPRVRRVATLGHGPFPRSLHDPGRRARLATEGRPLRGRDRALLITRCRRLAGQRTSALDLRSAHALHMSRTGDDERSARACRPWPGGVRRAARAARAAAATPGEVARRAEGEGRPTRKAQQPDWTKRRSFLSLAFADRASRPRALGMVAGLPLPPPAL